MVMTGCRTNEVYELERNEVIARLCYRPFGSESPADPSKMFYVEVKEDNSISSKEIFFLNYGFLAQSYYIENDIVKNYRWSDGLLNNTAQELQVWLDQHNMHETKAETEEITAVFVGCRWDEDSSAPLKEALKRLKWVGLSHEAPNIIKDFCDSVTADVNNPFPWLSPIPQYGRRVYPSYLRAIPLLSENERAQAENIPLVDIERYYITFACKSPYTLIPIQEKDSPFPALNKPYEPGCDKVRVKLDVQLWVGIERDPKTGWLGRSIYKDVPFYFLIETFKGESWDNEEYGVWNQ